MHNELHDKYVSVASQAACYRMQNGPKAEMEKYGRKIENGPRPEMAKRWPKNGETKKDNDPKSHCVAIFGPFIPHFPTFFAHFRLSARLPGVLTRKQ